MTTAIHPVAPEEIMALLDGELSADRSQTVSAHLQSCPECTATLAELRRVSQRFGAWIVGDVPPRVTSSVAAAQMQSSTHHGSRAPQRRSVLLWSLGIAAVVVLLFAVATPNLLRSRMAANEAAKIGRERAARQHQPVDFARSNTDKAESLSAMSDAYNVNGNSRSRFGKAKGLDALEAEPANLDGTLGKLGDRYKNLSAVNGGVVGDQTKPLEGPMIARTVSLSVLVKDFNASRNSLDSILARHNGYSANLTVSTPQGAAKSLQASLRIPALQLNAALAELKSLGRVENESQNGEEVTQQHADLVARLKNSRETEQRLQAILTQRTGKISDVLEVEQEIARVRGEIEQMEAEQKNLEHRVDFATVDLKLSEEYKAKLESTAPSISTQIHNALVNGYRNVADTLLALILFFAEYGPVLLLWCVFLLVPAYFLWRRWRTATASA